jgi:hypothetical protein
MGLSGRICPDCARRVSQPFTKTVTGREVCPACANALFLAPRWARSPATSAPDSGYGPCLCAKSGAPVDGSLYFAPSQPSGVLPTSSTASGTRFRRAGLDGPKLRSRSPHSDRPRATWSYPYCTIMVMIYGQSELDAIARQYLSPAMVDRWLQLGRPSARLTPTRGPGSDAATLGGNPCLPLDVEWPHWPDHGPLTFVAALDCARLPAVVDMPLPDDGMLLFFYFDGQIDDGEALVLASDPDSRPGSRVLYIPAGTPVSERSAPEGITAYTQVSLAARLTLSVPATWHPIVHAAFAPPGMPRHAHFDHPVRDDDFRDVVWDWYGGVGHQVGGFARPVQNPVEYEIAHAVLGGHVDWTDPRLTEEADQWLLLAQFDSEDQAGMMWGDCGALYWLIRRDDLVARRFDRTMFTWQCS